MTFHVSVSDRFRDAVGVLFLCVGVEVVAQSVSSSSTLGFCGGGWLCGSRSQPVVFSYNYFHVVTDGRISVIVGVDAA